MGHKDKLEYMLIGRALVFPNEFETIFEKKVKSDWFGNNELKEIFEKAEKQYLLEGKCQISAEEMDDNLLETLYDYGEYVTNINGVIESLQKEYRKRYLNQQISEILKKQDIGTEEKADAIGKVLEKINEIEDENYKIKKSSNLLSNWIKEIETKTLNGVKSPFDNMHEYFHFLGGHLIIGM
jgi:replicative DNA helicase